MVDVFCLNKDDHEQIGILIVSLEKLFFVAEVDVAGLVDVRLVAEIVVLHVVELVEHASVEHIREHVLLPKQSLVTHFRQLSFGVYPAFAVVS